ncbi:MAG TPA: hypothetical protein VHY48_05405 [Acidobacteriaceae bacterium]|jgi:hypothetical protein|nr:hypothetical protein [Acidobacteriaceae bacterium]
MLLLSPAKLADARIASRSIELYVTKSGMTQTQVYNKNLFYSYYPEHYGPMPAVIYLHIGWTTIQLLTLAVLAVRKGENATSHASEWTQRGRLNTLIAIGTSIYRINVP